MQFWWIEQEKFKQKIYEPGPGDREKSVHYGSTTVATRLEFAAFSVHTKFYSSTWWLGDTLTSILGMIRSPTRLEVTDCIAVRFEIIIVREWDSIYYRSWVNSFRVCQRRLCETGIRWRDRCRSGGFCQEQLVLQWDRNLPWSTSRGAT